MTRITGRRDALRLLREPRFHYACLARGMSCRQIAELLGVHRTTVRERWRQFGIKPRLDADAS